MAPLKIDELRHLEEIKLHSYQGYLCMFYKNKKTIDSLTTFLSKYSKKVTDKNKKTKKKSVSKKTKGNSKQNKR